MGASSIVGPPLAGGLGRPEGNASGGGPTIRGGSTSHTIRPYIVGPPLAGGLGRPEGNASGGTLLYTEHGCFVYSRATPCGWPAWRSHCLNLTPNGLALLYTMPRMAHGDMPTLE